jgi:hypothetical protein
LLKITEKRSKGLGLSFLLTPSIPGSVPIPDESEGRVGTFPFGDLTRYLPEKIP